MNYANFGWRFIAFLLDILPITPIVAAYFYFFLGFVWAAFSKQSRAWHDSLAKTFVVTRSASD